MRQAYQTKTEIKTPTKTPKKNETTNTLSNPAIVCGVSDRARDDERTSTSLPPSVCTRTESIVQALGIGRSSYSRCARLFRM